MKDFLKNNWFKFKLGNILVILLSLTWLFGLGQLAKVSFFFEVILIMYIFIFMALIFNFIWNWAHKDNSNL